MMRSYLLVVLFIAGFYLLSEAQVGLEHRQPETVSHVDVIADPDVIYLPMPFAKSTWADKLRSIGKTKQILSISLVYTRFRSVSTFNQVKLNSDRIDQLRRAVPSLFESRSVLWRLVEQTAATTQEEAKRLFHGFVIHTRSLPTTALMNEELNLLQEMKSMLDKESLLDGSSGAGTESLSGSGSDTEMAKNVSKAYYFMDESAFRNFDNPASFVGGNGGLHTFLVSNLRYPEKAITDSIEGTVNLAFEVLPSGKLNHIRVVGSVSTELDEEAKRVLHLSPDWIPAKFNGYPVASNYTMPITFDMDGDGKVKTQYVEKTRVSSFIPFAMDNTVIATLNRNTWTELAIVCDLTGSMSPYTAQLLRWFRSGIDTSNVHSFTFFNDGDGKRDNSKSIGRTDGIYHTSETDFGSVFKLVTTTMENGNGGDVQENNIEAALQARSKCEKCDIVLICDNFATPRDLVLHDKLSGPIHIIVCGSNLGLNLNYVQLAWQTEATLHTLTQDINLKDLKEGSTIEIGRDLFKLLNGKIVRLR